MATIGCTNCFTNSRYNKKEVFYIYDGKSYCDKCLAKIQAKEITSEFFDGPGNNIQKQETIKEEVSLPTTEFWRGTRIDLIDKDGRVLVTMPILQTIVKGDVITLPPIKFP